MPDIFPQIQDTLSNHEDRITHVETHASDHVSLLPSVIARVNGVESRVTALETKPAPVAMVDLTPLNTLGQSLENRVSALELALAALQVKG